MPGFANPAWGGRGCKSFIIQVKQIRMQNYDAAFMGQLGFFAPEAHCQIPPVCETASAKSVSVVKRSH